MKKLIVLTICIISLQTYAQKKDSTYFRKNEIGLNTLPIITFLAGYIGGDATNFNLQYRRFINSKNTLRTSINSAPYQNAGFS